MLINGLGPIPAFGLNGAAMATTIGRGVGVVYQLYHLFKAQGVVKIHKNNVKFDLPIIKSMISIASPATFQFIIGSCSWIVLARLVAETGHSTASAGYQTAIRVVIFFILPAWGMVMRLQRWLVKTGALQPERAAESVMKRQNTMRCSWVWYRLYFFLGHTLLLVYSPMMKQ